MIISDELLDIFMNFKKIRRFMQDDGTRYANITYRLRKNGSR